MERSPAELHRLLLRWYARQRRDLPWRRTRDPYRVLVAEVMLQQTQVERVLPKYEEFLRRFPTLIAVAEASPGEVLRVWGPLGYNRRALYLHRAARLCVERHGGALPQDIGQLQALPGVGAYTARAVASFAFGQEIGVLDTNVRRVLGRAVLGMAGGAPAGRSLQRLADRLVPAGHGADWNQALMDLGATLCRARSPRCRLCPLAPACAARPALERPPAPALASPRRRPPFQGSRRYYRGRVLALLRATPAGEGLPWRCIVQALAPEASPTSHRLTEVLSPLVREGLLEVQPALPEGAGPSDELYVYFPR